MNPKPNPVQKFHTLNNNGERAEIINHDSRDKNQLLGVLLRTEEIENVGSLGHFYVAFQKPAKIKLEMFAFVRVGSLVRFDKKEYYQKMEQVDDKRFSTALLTYLDATTFYQNFEIDTESLMFRCNVLNYQPAYVYKNPDASAEHPIFGRLLFNGYKFEIRTDKKCKIVSVESNIPSDSQSFENMKFFIKQAFSTMYQVEIFAENPPREVIVDENEVIIDPTDIDTIYGIVWSYREQTPEMSVFQFFSKQLGENNNKDKQTKIKNCRFVMVSGEPNIPVGGLIRLSRSEWEAKYEKPSKIDGLSTASVTYLPNHKLYKFQFSPVERYFFTLEDYTIRSCIENINLNRFNHELFGEIADESKVIRNTPYSKIQLKTLRKHNDDPDFMSFFVNDVSEVPVVTDAERMLRQLPMKKRSKHFSELLKMEEKRVLVEERSKWRVIGTLEVKKNCQLGGLGGVAPYFKTDRFFPLLKTILKHKSVIVYLEKSGGSQKNLQKPYGSITRIADGFCFTPVGQYRAMVFEIGDRYNFVPKSIERSSEYYEEMRQIGDSLSRYICSVPTETSGVDHQKLNGMYTAEVDLEDPKLIGEDFILNEEQKKAVRMGLNDSRKLVIIHGPPGTGKTHVLAELICQFILKAKKLLVIAPSNSAIDCVFDASLKLLQARGIYRNEYHMPIILTPEVLCKQMKVCGFNEDLEKWKGYLEHGITDQDDYDKAEKRMMSCMMKEYFKNALVCLCTTNNRFSHFSKHHGFETDTVIVDEAGMVQEEHLSRNLPQSITRIIMAGDPKQLQVTVREDPSDAADLAEMQMSAMERLMRASSENVSYAMLKVQYRMHPQIMRLSSELFYERELIAHESVHNINVHDLFGWKLHQDQKDFEELQMPVVFCDTATSERQPNVEKYCFDKLVFVDNGNPIPSYCNPGEAAYVVRYLNKLLQNSVDMNKVSIITPYRAQVATIQQLLQKDHNLQNLRVKVGTIESFQGKENDIVIVSLVRYNPKRNTGVLSNPNMTNVMLTRARRQLFIIGHSSTVLYHDRGILPKLSEMLISTKAVIARALLGSTHREWANTRRDRFGPKFSYYLKFNPDDEGMRNYVKQFLETKNALMEEKDNGDEESEKFID